MTQTQQLDHSLEDFLGQPGAPTDARHWLDAAYEAPDPMTMVGAALCGLLGTVVEGKAEEARDAAVASGDLVSAEAVAELESLNAIRSGEVARLEDVLDEVMQACGKSRAQLAVKVREIITAARQPARPTPEPVVEPEPTSE